MDRPGRPARPLARNHHHHHPYWNTQLLCGRPRPGKPRPHRPTAITQSYFAAGDSYPSGGPCSAEVDGHLNLASVTIALGGPGQECGAARVVEVAEPR